MAKPFKGAEKSAVVVLSFVRTRTFTIAIFFIIASIFILTIVSNTKIVQVNDSNSLKNVFTLRVEPKTILDQCGIKLNSDDTINFTGFKNNYGKIEIIRAFPVMITADQKTQNISISHGTVSDALIRAGVKVGSDDIVSQSLTTPVSKGLKVQIKRVTYKVVQQNQVLNCKLVEQQTPLLNKGKTKVVEPGTNGQFTITMQLRYVDGTVEKTDVIKQEITKKPTDGKVLVGTSAKTPVSRLDVGGQILTDRGDPVRYSKCLTGAATAYYAKSGSGTASGKKVAVGNIAVNPKLIPYGTRLYIVSSDGSFVYGNAVAADTGGFCNNGSGVLADLYFNTNAECNMFGKRNIKIYILE
jgi:3D (Asp-Asp-Asp) domain-containing protein